MFKRPGWSAGGRLMGWAYCGKDNRGREIGYGIQATCDQRGCDEVINRGLGYCCGPMHNGDEGGCGGYYCDEHLGWVGPRGGCPHRGRSKTGVTLCQPLRSDITREVWCACGYGHSVEWPREPEAGGINAVRSALHDFYPTPDKQDAWLDAPHPLLGGSAAGDLVGTARESEVWALIDQLRSGAVV